MRVIIVTYIFKNLTFNISTSTHMLTVYLNSYTPVIDQLWIMGSTIIVSERSHQPQSFHNLSKSLSELMMEWELKPTLLCHSKVTKPGYVRKPEVESLWIIVYNYELLFLEYLKTWKAWEKMRMWNHMHVELFMLRMECQLLGMMGKSQCENVGLFYKESVKQSMPLFIQSI